MAVQELKYQVVIDWITSEITEGRLKTGDQLMPEEKICRKFGLSRQTIRRAMQELVKKGVISRIQGSGTYVGSYAPEFSRQRYMNAAVISTYYRSYIFPMTLRGIEKTLSKAGYAMQVSFTDNKVSKETVILKQLLMKDNIDGLIVEPSKGALPNPNIGLYKELMERHIPIIFFNDIYPALEAACVRIDDYAVAKHAARLLIQAGHKKLAGIFKLDDGQGRRRYHGFLDALMEAELKLNSRQIFWVDTEAQAELKEMGAYLFRRIEGCTGIVCYNDEVAKQVISLAADQQIRIPQDLSVVSIDNSELAEISRVPFTSFPHPQERLGEKAAENLLKMMDDPMFNGNYIFDAQPVFRDSIRKIQ